MDRFPPRAVDQMEKVKAEVARLAAVINAPPRLLPAFSSTGSPETWLEVDSYGFHVLFDDSGRELVRTTYGTMDDMLYHVFQSVSFSMANDWGVKNRVKGQGSRRNWFQLQEQLMESLSPAWGARKRAEHARVLERHPFSDEGERTIERREELMRQGVPREEAVARANREMPTKPTDARRQLLVSLVQGMLSVEHVRKELGHFPWDSDEELVWLHPEDFIRALDSFLRGRKEAQQVEDWANAIEGRDDIGFEAGQEALLKAVLHELANPTLEGPLTRQSAQRLVVRLRASGGAAMRA